MAILEHSSVELRSYLRRRRSGRATEHDPIFEAFLKDVSMLFSLRTAAEEYWFGSPRSSDFTFAEHRYQANSLMGALPLEWKDIYSIVVPDDNEPRRTLITIIAAHCAEEVRLISSGLRKVLSRDRLSTPVGKVQQLDTYCMRWLMRQPGRSFVEKAGTKQRVMAVVRREQFDTLENRVFKDFLIRCENLADGYLSETEKDFSWHKMYKSVRAFYVACQGALALPEMDLISGISDLPRPNYVLQQDNRYSKIWNAYCKVVRLSNLADKLWTRRDELAETLLKLIDESLWQCQHSGATKYYTQVWFNQLDGKMSFLEQAKVHHAEIGQAEQVRRNVELSLVRPSNGAAVMDFTGCHVWGPALSLGGYHQNARPRIYKPDFPLLDDELAERDKKSTKHYLRDILTKLNDVNVQNNKDVDKTYHECSDVLSAYCARLFGECRNQDRNLSEIVVLSPDDWNAITQEQVIRSFPMLERKKVHLLWRSVATAIGLADEINGLVEENDVVSIVDFRLDGTILISQLKFMREDGSNRLIPQRSVYRRNEKINAERYALLKNAGAMSIMSHELVRRSKVVCLSGCISPSFKSDLKDRYCLQRKSETIRYIHYEAERGGNVWSIFEDSASGWTQKDGALLFCHEHEKRTLYFDELDAMWAVGQFNEKVVKTPMVIADDRFKGGATKIIDLRQGFLQIGEGQQAVEFLFHIGELRDSTLLHSYKEELPDLVVRKNIDLSCRIEVSPGQGIAITTVETNQLKEPIVLDYLRNMNLCKWSVQKLEEEMPRSFPPTCAIVESYPDEVWYGAATFWGHAPVHTLEKVKKQVQDYIAGKIGLSGLPDDAFAHAQRKSINDLAFGESKLHLLDRRNVFGNTLPKIRPSWLTERDEESLIRKLIAGIPQNHDKCMRLLAWTYRGDNPDLAKRVARLVKDYSQRRTSTASIDAVGVSFLSNFLTAESQADHELITLNTIRARLENGVANGNDLRLFYNLMQFDISMFSKFKFPTKSAANIIRWLLRDMQAYRRAGKPTNYKSCIRVFLYFLRIREDERLFLRPSSMYDGVSRYDNALKTYMAETFESANRELSNKYPDESDDTRMLRLAAMKYLNGQGTLDDIVSVTGGD